MKFTKKEIIALHKAAILVRSTLAKVKESEESNLTSRTYDVLANLQRELKKWWF